MRLDDKNLHRQNIIIFRKYGVLYYANQYANLLLGEFDGGAGELEVADHLVERGDHGVAVVRVHPVGVLVLDGRQTHGAHVEVELLYRIHELLAGNADVLLQGVITR